MTILKSLMCKNGQDIHVRSFLHGFASPSMRYFDIFRYISVVSQYLVTNLISNNIYVLKILKSSTGIVSKK